MEGTSIKIKINDIRIVKKFLDVFPEELSSLPPKREVKFIIDLIPDSVPILKVLYRITHKELEELKI